VHSRTSATSRPSLFKQAALWLLVLSHLLSSLAAAAAPVASNLAAPASISAPNQPIAQGNAAQAATDLGVDTTQVSISITATGIAGSTRTVVLPDGTTQVIANPSGISLAGVTLTTPGQLALDAGTATIAFNLMQTGATTSQTQQQRDLVYQTARGQGGTLNQAEYNQLSYGSLSLGGSVTVQVASNSNQRGNTSASTGPQEAVTTGSSNPSASEQTLTQLAQQPGMAWVGDVVRQQQQAALAQYWIGRVVQYSISAGTCVRGYSSALSL
jgi:hypothetical protein